MTVPRPCFYNLFFQGLDQDIAIRSIIFPFVHFQGVKGVSMCPAFFVWPKAKWFTARKYPIPASDRREYYLTKDHFFSSSTLPDFTVFPLKER
jgi:hypothetical protein